MANLNHNAFYTGLISFNQLYEIHARSVKGASPNTCRGVQKAKSAFGIANSCYSISCLPNVYKYQFFFTGQLYAVSV